MKNLKFDEVKSWDVQHNVHPSSFYSCTSIVDSHGCVIAEVKSPELAQLIIDLLLEHYNHVL